MNKLMQSQQSHDVNKILQWKNNALGQEFKSAVLVFLFLNTSSVNAHLVFYSSLCKSVLVFSLSWTATLKRHFLGRVNLCLSVVRN